MLTTPRLILRRFSLDDLPAFLAYRNDPEVARYQGWDSTTEEEGRAYIEYHQHIEPHEPGWFNFAIIETATQNLIGDIGLNILEHDPQQAKVGYSLARHAQGNGYATEALRAVLDYAFGELKLHRISATCDVDNQGSIALLERVKFRREGHLIENYFDKGEWTSEYLYAMLRREWQTSDS